jgi:hypothetical protein
MASVPPARQGPCEGPPSAGTWDKWNQAGAQAYYACRYFAAIQDTNTVRNIIAGLQLLAQYYFADKQYEVAKQAQERLDNISNIELDRSGKLFGQFEKQIAAEDIQRVDAMDISVPEPLWNQIRLRVTASVVRQFTEARRKVLECYPVSCMEARCNALLKLETEQAKTIASEVEQAYQRERALWELRKETKRAHRLDVLKFGRGALGNANSALDGARAAVNQSASINPYSGWIQAVNSTAQTAQGITTQEALAFRGMGANVGNAWSLGQNANTTATEMTNGISARIYDPDMGVYAAQQQLNNASNGNVDGDVRVYAPDGADPGTPVEVISRQK